MGAFASSGGAASPLGVFLVTWIANVLSAAGVYFLARRFGPAAFASALGRRLLNPAALKRLEYLYAEHGSWGIFVSRFVPGIRAVVPPFAGVVGLGAVRALVPAMLASGIWYAAIVYLVWSAAEEIEDAARIVDQLNTWTAVLAVAAAAIAAVLFWRHRRNAARRSAGIQ
jgi:membrane protein DedA with SNARE-associated domain